MAASIRQQSKKADRVAVSGLPGLLFHGTISGKFRPGQKKLLFPSIIFVKHLV
ncbi:MAG TPA: hypothetical protein IAD36_08740 [Candidatus Scatomorpha intestinigallinarum]|uniref:Uncharacterized protein n=1 Tax=Candidatus Scatomorpha intestinigallinarum TaxID=2840923 RepID=A0A9D1DML5_9FIRM|nr:hypothetical protein [Candidatus Scatomorpha intestinigallinarum]